MLKNSRIGTIAALGVVAAIGIGSLVVASNMGFKGKFAFTANEKTWFSPPFHSPYQTANDLMVAINGAGASPNGGVVQRTVATNPPSFQFWDSALRLGNGEPANFVLNAGEGYEIKSNATVTPVVVGSHNPFTALPLAQNGLPANAAAGIPLGGSTPAGFVANRDYLISVPWHTTYLTAEDLRADLPGAQRVIRVEQNVGQSPAFFFWNGDTGNDTPKNFAVTLGEAYEVRVLQSTPQGATPSHF
jgi:hypothetical protein